MSGKAVDLTGQKIGKLTIIKRAEDIVSASGKTKSKAWLCKCDCGNEIIMKESTLKTETHNIRSCGCVKYVNYNYIPKHMSLDELVYWEKLYEYVNYKIMCYDKNMLSSYMISRLKGMRENKIFQKGKQDVDGIYSSEIILNTFKFCSIEIDRSLKYKSFKDEISKFNYILAIVESNLNTVYVRMKQNKKEKEKIEEIKLDNIRYSGAEYQSKTEKTLESLDDLW